MEGAVGAVFATMMGTIMLQMSTVGNNDSYPVSRPNDLNEVGGVM